MATAKASEVAKQPPDRGKAMSFVSQVFALNPQGINWARGVFFLDVALVPYVVLAGRSGSSSTSSAPCSRCCSRGVSDPGGSFGYRALRLAVFGLVGAAVTALGFGIATSGWGWLVLAVFVVTLVSGLAVKFGAAQVRSRPCSSTPGSSSPSCSGPISTAPTSPVHTWAQALAWVGGRRCGSPSRSLGG